MTTTFNEGGIINEKLGGLQDDMAGVRNTLTSINAQLAALVRLEENHNHTVKAVERSFTEIGNVKADMLETTKRLASIEMHMPGLKELRRWVIGGLAIALCMVISSVISLVISANKKEDFMYQMLLKKDNPTPVPPVAKVP
jgi:uncharacterized membrane protein YqjE